MSAHNGEFQKAMSRLLSEIFEGPQGGVLVIDPGDPGLLGRLEAVDAAAASARPMPGRTTIAMHVDHVVLSLEMFNRWATGESNPWATADWSAAWERKQLTETEWRGLRDRLRQQAAAVREAVMARSHWDESDIAHALSIGAHTAYHMGAIRQILVAQGR
jgi:hypothetical protein